MTSGRATEWENCGMTVEPITRRDVGEPWPHPYSRRQGPSRVRTGSTGSPSPCEEEQPVDNDGCGILEMGAGFGV